MNDSSRNAVLDELLGPVTDCFTQEVAHRIAGLRASPEIEARLDNLADKCSEAAPTHDERAAYEAAVRAVNFIGVLQAKARAMLGDRETTP